MKRILLLLLAGASVSACAGREPGPMKALDISSVSMTYMRVPHPVPLAGATTDTLVVQSKRCFLPRRDRVAIFEALRRAHPLEPLYDDDFRIGESSPRTMLIVFRSKRGVAFTAVVPDAPARQLILFNGERARIDTADLAIAQSAAVRSGCSTAERRVQ